MQFGTDNIPPEDTGLEEAGKYPIADATKRSLAKQHKAPATVLPASRRYTLFISTRSQNQQSMPWSARSPGATSRTYAMSGY
eukprot:3899429-Pyramimonas_sp.AAC.1